MKLIISGAGEVLADEVKIADRFWDRFLGLMGKRQMPAGTALVLLPCKSVHTFFMRFSIDVVFLDKNGVVKHIIPDMPPFRASRYVSEARMAVEFPGGTIQNRLRPGDRLVIEGCLPNNKG